MKFYANFYWHSCYFLHGLNNEYSPDKDANFYFLCIIFNKPFEILRHNAFTIDGFKKKKKIGIEKEERNKLVHFKNSKDQKYNLPYVNSPLNFSIFLIL